MSDSERDFPLVHDILRRRRKRTLLRGAIVLLLIGAGVAAWLGLRNPTPPPVAAPSAAPPPFASQPAPIQPPPPAPEPIPAPPPVAAAPPPTFIVPALSESDSVVRELAGGITAQSQLGEWLEADGLIRRFVVAVASVAEGRTPRDQLAPAWPEQDFEVEATEERVLADPASYARYDAVTEVFVSTDTQSALDLYRKLEPLFDEAYAELGYPETPFREALMSAIGELLATPVLVGEPELRRRVLTWEYVDPELEALSPAQKQLLRMGPVNAPRVQRKLRALGKALGMPTHAMPATQIYELARSEPEQ